MSLALLLFLHLSDAAPVLPQRFLQETFEHETLFLFKECQIADDESPIIVYGYRIDKTSWRFIKVTVLDEHLNHRLCIKKKLETKVFSIPPKK